jgi:hypothetical protein
MANTIVSPNMSLPIPITGVDPGPDWANNINASLLTLDSHSHIPGSGVQITPLAMNINSDLTFASNNAYGLRSARFVSNLAILSLAGDIGCSYNVLGDLYWNNSTGTAVQITSGGSVVGSAGTITGLPSGTASASYAAGTFTFKSATSTSANIDGQSFLLRNNSAGSKKLILSPPGAMGSDISLTLPSPPSANNTIIAYNTDGTMFSYGVLDNSSLENSSGTIRIKARGVSTGNIAVGAVGSTEIAVASIQAINIAAGTIQGTNIAAGTIAASNIVSSVNLIGANIQAAGHNVVVSNTNASNNLSIVRGIVGSAGTLLLGEGWTATNPSSNNYTINFSVAFSVPPVVTASCDTSTRFVTIVSTSTTSISLLVSGTALNPNVHFIAIGVVA